MKRAILVCMALLLATGPLMAADEQMGAEISPPRTEHAPSAATMLADGILVRPVGIVAIAVGFVGTVATLPFSLPSGSVKVVARKLISEPVAFTFTRPLGVFPGAESLD